MPPRRKGGAKAAAPKAADAPQATQPTDEAEPASLSDLLHIDGVMLKLGDKGPIRRWKQRYFEHRGGRLYYYMKKGDEQPISSIPLQRAISIDIGSPPNLPWRKSLDCCLDIAFDKRIYHLACDNKDSRNKWLGTLIKIREEYLLRGDDDAADESFDSADDLDDEGASVPGSPDRQTVTMRTGKGAPRPISHLEEIQVPTPLFGEAALPAVIEMPSASSGTASLLESLLLPPSPPPQPAEAAPSLVSNEVTAATPSLVNDDVAALEIHTDAAPDTALVIDAITDAMNDVMIDHVEIESPRALSAHSPIDEAPGEQTGEQPDQATETTTDSAVSLALSLAAASLAAADQLPTPPLEAARPFHPDVVSQSRSLSFGIEHTEDAVERAVPAAAPSASQAAAAPSSTAASTTSSSSSSSSLLRAKPPTPTVGAEGASPYIVRSPATLKVLLKKRREPDSSAVLSLSGQLVAWRGGRWELVEEEEDDEDDEEQEADVGDSNEEETEQIPLSDTLTAVFYPKRKVWRVVVAVASPQQQQQPQFYPQSQPKGDDDFDNASDVSSVAGDEDEQVGHVDGEDEASLRDNYMTLAFAVLNSFKRSANEILRSFEGLSPEQAEWHGSDARNPALGSLVRAKLCADCARVLMHGLRAQTHTHLFGLVRERESLWDVAVEVTADSPWAASIAFLNGIAAMAADPNVKLRALFCILLTRKELAMWFAHVAAQTEFLERRYVTAALLRDEAAVGELVSVAKAMERAPLLLSVFFEVDVDAPTQPIQILSGMASDIANRIKEENVAQHATNAVRVLQKEAAVAKDRIKQELATTKTTFTSLLSRLPTASALLQEVASAASASVPGLPPTAPNSEPVPPPVSAGGSASASGATSLHTSPLLSSQPSASASAAPLPQPSQPTAAASSATASLAAVASAAAAQPRSPSKASPPAALEEVELNKLESGYGFLIQARPGVGIVIVEINKNGAAYLSGRLHVGDVIVAVNGTSVVNMSQPDFVNVLRKAPSVRFGIVSRKATGRQFI